MNSPKPVHTSPEDPDNHPAEVDGWPPVVRPGSRTSVPNTDRSATSTDMSTDTSADTTADMTGPEMTGPELAGPEMIGPDSLAVDMADAEFWQSRPELAAVHQYARAALASPWAVLGCVLARVALSTPPALVLPPLGNGVGAPASLNLFVGLVGPSGVGKGVATSAARGFLDITPGKGRLIEERPLGSGEGISHVFIETDDDGHQVPAGYSVWFDVPEVDTLTALVQRQGSTTAAEVRKMFSGEGLGFQNSDRDRRKIVPAHTYRAALVAGVQPRKAGPLLGDDAGGTPQRFLWMPATDPGAPDTPPERPAALGWSSPVLATQTGRVMLDVAESIRDQMRRDVLARLREQVEDGNGQQGLVRLKVAALLALLARRTAVTPDDWQLAEYVMGVSDHTRDRMRLALNLDAERAARARAEARAALDEHHDDAAVRRAAIKVLKRLGTEPTSASAVLASLGANQREHFTAALDLLTREGRIERHDDEYRGRPRTLLRLRA